MADENELPVTPEPTPAPEPDPTPVADPEPATQEATDPPAAAADEKKPRQTGKPFQQRIDQLTREKNEEKRAREAAEAEIARLRAVNPADPAQASPKQGPSGQELSEQLINRRAQEIVAAERYGRQINATLAAGKKDFTDFDDRCNTLASLGANERPDFLQIVTDGEIIPDGHKVLASLAEDTTEAARILSLPPVQMSAALVRYSENLNRPKSAAVSRAPAPFKPLNGGAKASEELSSNDSEDDWFRKREAQVAARKTAGARSL